MRSSRSTASTPTLMDSTMFSLNSFSRSYWPAFCSSDLYRRAFCTAMPMYPASVSSSCTSSLERKSPSAGLAQAQHRDHAVHHRAGNVVVQLQPANRLARAEASRAPPGWCCRRTGGRPATPAARRAGSRRFEPAGVGNAVRLGQRELLRLLRIRQEDGQPVHQQRARQAVDDRGQHLVEIGFGIQVAAELDQRLPVVVTFAIEELVEIVLHPVLERDRTATRSPRWRRSVRSVRRWGNSGGRAPKPCPPRQSTLP